MNANNLSLKGHACVNQLFALKHADDFKLAVWEIKRVGLGWFGFFGQLGHHRYFLLFNLLRKRQRHSRTERACCHCDGLLPNKYAQTDDH